MASLGRIPARRRINEIGGANPTMSRAHAATENMRRVVLMSRNSLLDMFSRSASQVVAGRSYFCMPPCIKLGVVELGFCLSFILALERINQGDQQILSATDLVMAS